MKIKFYLFVLILIISIFTFSNLYSHTGHYKDLKKLKWIFIEMVEIIGYSNYF